MGVDMTGTKESEKDKSQEQSEWYVECMASQCGMGLCGM